MGRAPCCDKANVKKGPWSPEEDTKLKEYIDKYGTGGNWIALPLKADLKRCGKSCRLRWLNYLRPNIKHGQFSDDEDTVICSLFASIGSRWSIIAAQLPGRTDNDIKNYWNTKLKKKFLGIAPCSQITKPLPPVLFQSPFFQNENNYYPLSKSSLGLEPSNFFNTITTSRTITSLLEIESKENLVGFMQQQYQEKDSNLLMFGTTATGEPSCSSSDGSCNQISYNNNNNNNNKDIEYEYSGNAAAAAAAGVQVGQESYFCNGVQEDQKFMLGVGSGGSVGWTDQRTNNGMWSEPPLPLLDYGGCNLFSSSDETKPQQQQLQQGRVMYL